MKLTERAEAAAMAAATAAEVMAAGKVAAASVELEVGQRKSMMFGAVDGHWAARRT